jgi:hypothetical protein
MCRSLDYSRSVTGSSLLSDVPTQGCERLRVLSGPPSRLCVCRTRGRISARMSFHGKAKLGLAGRHALVGATESGMALVTAHRPLHRRLDARDEARRTPLLPVRSVKSAALLAAAARARARRAICACPSQDQVRTTACRWRNRLRALDRLEGPLAGQDLAAAVVRTRAVNRYE